MNNNLLKTKTYNQNDNQISTLISGQHELNVTVTDSGLNIRVNGNARSLSLFSRSMMVYLCQKRVFATRCNYLQRVVIIYNVL